MLSLRHERWVWHMEPTHASWWVVDGTRESLPELTVALHQAKVHAPLWGVLLAPDWSSVKDPVWTFFKVPLQFNQVYRWLDACHPQSAAPVNPFAGQRLKLRRWPNMSRYGNDTHIADSMQLTVACARLLREPVDYDEARTLVHDTTVLDTLLRDALQDGILELTPATPGTAPVTHSVTAAATSAVTPPVLPTAHPPAPHHPPHADASWRPAGSDDRSAWSLVKRLIQKFT